VGSKESFKPPTLSPAYRHTGVESPASSEVIVVPALAVLFILVPLAELAVIIAVGKAVGVLATLLMLLAFSLFGAWLAKREGLAAWRRFQLAMAEGRVPTREVADGAMILLAGALLLTPGFLTDLVGLVLLVPPSRALARRWAPALARRRAFRRRTRITVTGPGPGAGPGGSTEVVWGRPELDDPPAPGPRPAPGSRPTNGRRPTPGPRS